LYFNALIARNLFDDVGYYRIAQKNDNMISKVLELDAKSAIKQE
jgi:hypothetical protein